ncbi:MAG: DEAD/DEAH box helicase, partial [Rhodobacteraceae bacterium]|nr:DEAD/DEAH box helicase [Paracoccaceae bacterium]
QTGTGKTAAFGLPLIEQLCADRQRPEPKCARSLILAPTRELVNQIVDNLRQFSRHTDLRIATVVGGTSINNQRRNLHRGVDILVATPGRLLNLIEIKALRIDTVTFLVLDEADQMLDIGFIHALRQIARLLPPKRQTMLFSATMPKLMDEIAATYLTNPIRVQVSPPGKVADKITQGVHFTGQGDKAKLLAEYLSAHPGDLALVFGRTKHGADKLMKLLTGAGFSVGAIHGSKSQGQRERALQAFRDGAIKVLVATDVAARGIDIPDVRHVYNYDLPNVPENYVHRIGRTARAGKAGRAVAFCAPAEFGELRAIEKVLKEAIPVLAGNPPSAAEAGSAAKSARGGRGKTGGNHPATAGQRKEGATKRPSRRRPARRPRRDQAA